MAATASATPDHNPKGPDPRPDTTRSATLVNFLSPDPLDGDNGLPTSPAVDASRYGPINLGLDVDGNAIEATITADVSYFKGKYYLHSSSYSCGSFDYAPGADMTPTLRSNPGSFYRYCGLVIYESVDLMNWKLVNRVFPQDPDTGRVYTPKKTRVVYSEKTRMYTMWFGNGQGGPYSGKRIMQSETPVGPWSTPRQIDNPLDPTDANLLRDFDLGTDTKGETWMAVSHGEIRLFRLNEAKTGVVEQVSTGADTSILNGGIGMHYENGWWYITGSPGCGNCLGARFSYIMAKDPRGPWTSPDDDPNTPLVEPTILSEDSGYAQANSSSTLPDGKGGTRTLIPFKHYISSPTGAPAADSLRQPGDANLALGGLWWYPLTYDAEGHIEPMEITPTSQFPLAKPVKTTVPDAYQADLSVTASRSIVQSWVEPRKSVVRTVLPSLFQRTPDNSPRNAASSPPQDPMVNAPLTATLTLPNGRKHTWKLDPRTIAWSPQQIPLTLPKAYKGGGRFTLTLTTSATNGGYGVAVGPALPGGVYQHVEGGTAKSFASASMALKTSSSAAKAPKITTQPRDATVLVGAETGFVVEASGIGVGYQWKRNGQIILAPDGLNESTASNFRRDLVTKSDAGTYTVEVFNAVGKAKSKKAQLNVIDATVTAALEQTGATQTVTVTATNSEPRPVDVTIKTEWGTRKLRQVASGATVSTTFNTNRTDIILGDARVSVTAKLNGKQVTAGQLVHYGEPIFNE